MNKTTRRWWIYIYIKKKILSKSNNINYLSILKLKKLTQLRNYHLMNHHFLLYGLVKHKTSNSNLCFHSLKYKKLVNLCKINRWNFLKGCNAKNIPNVKKFVW